MNRGMDCGRKSKWYSAAMLAPVVHGASGSGWLGVLCAGVGAMVLGMMAQQGRGWVLKLQRAWTAILAGVILGWSRAYWQTMPFCDYVPFVLLALALWSVWLPKKAEQLCRVLSWPVAFLLGCVILSSLPEIDIAYLEPDWDAPEPALLSLLLLPGCRTGLKSNWKNGVVALIMAVVSCGVLSSQVSREAASGIYEVSRSLRLLGIAERFESLVAAAMTLGFFSAIACLLDFGEADQRDKLVNGALAALVCITGMPFGAWSLPLGGVLVWCVVPSVFDRIAEKKKSRKNHEKREKRP